MEISIREYFFIETKAFYSRIIEALDSNNTLRELEFGFVSDESLSYLAEFLGKNSSVKNIGLEEGRKR